MEISKLYDKLDENESFTSEEVKALLDDLTNINNRARAIKEKEHKAEIEDKNNSIEYWHTAAEDIQRKNEQLEDKYKALSNEYVKICGQRDVLIKTIDVILNKEDN